MISTIMPATLRDYWRRIDPHAEDGSARPAAHDDIHDSSGETHDHDFVARYALVGILIILATASLSIARPIALPIVSGVIFGLVLGPLVDRMVRAGVPQGLAAALLVLCGLVIMILVIGIFAAPFAIWSDRLPGIIAALRDRLSDITDLAKRLEGLAGGAIPGAPETPQVTVTVAEPSNPLMNIALTSTAAAGAMLIFIATIYFYLATRRHLKARALRLCLGGSARRSAGAFFERIEIRIASYFGVVTVINLGMGLATTIIAWLAGLPFPLFWGLIAFVLNYIIFIGPTIMVGLLFGAGLLDDSSGLHAAWPAAAYFTVNLIEGNFITPLLVGRRLTVSPFLVFVSFVFWLWLWGPVGAFLSTPLLLVISLSIEAVREHKRMEAEAEEAAKAAAAAENEAAELAAVEAAATTPLSEPGSAIGVPAPLSQKQPLAANG